MIINSISDLANYLDCGVELNCNNEEIYEMTLTHAARAIRNMPMCPEYGEDWSLFLETINCTDLLVETADKIALQL
jgi:trans-2-enoyl-CoA reductase